MLLVLDVGNTNTVLGVFAKSAKGDGAGVPHYEHMEANWRVATIATQTVDEYGVLFRNLFAMEKIEVKGIRRDRHFFGCTSPRLNSASGLRTLLQYQAVIH